MSTLPAPVAAMSAKILGRFGNNADSEILAASRALARTLDCTGLGLADLVAHGEACPLVVARNGSQNELACFSLPKDWRVACEARGNN